MNDLIEKVVEWAEDRGIITGSSPEKQMLKTIEELGELCKAVAKDDMPGIIDGIGDVLVTLIIQAQMRDLTLEHCLQSAYDVISKRKGAMRNGMFEKEQTMSNEELRDKIAIAAMSSFLTSPVDSIAREAFTDQNRCAKWAYEQADAMLAERAKK